MAGEFTALINLFKERKVGSYLEIGAREGDSFHEIMVNLPRGSRGVAVDLPGGLWGKATTDKKLIRACDDLRRRGYDVSHLFGDSATAATSTLAKMRGPYDAILIDGSHRYDDVKRDWEIYGSWAPIIVFHDIVGHGQADKVAGNPVEVPRLWQEIKSEFGSFLELIDPGSKMGLGVVLL